MKKGSTMGRKGSQKGSLSGGNLPKLTKTEAEVLSLLNDFLNVPQIARRRKTSKRAVYKIIQKLVDKGHYNRFTKKVHKSDAVVNLSQFKTGARKQLRLHGEEFNIKICWKDKRYENIRAKSNKITIDGNTIRLYRNSIEVYSNHSIFGRSPQEVTTKSIKYWRRIFAIVENDLRIIISKPRVQNIKLVRAHLAEVDNELAKDHETKGEKFEIKDKFDGKPWLWIDNSFNLHELETGHPETFKQDMEVVQDFFNDLRDNEPIKVSDIKNLIGELAKNSQKTEAIIRDLAKNSKETAEGLNVTVKVLNKVVERIQ